MLTQVTSVFSCSALTSCHCFAKQAELSEGHRQGHRRKLCLFLVSLGAGEVVSKAVSKGDILTMVVVIVVV